MNKLKYLLLTAFVSTVLFTSCEETLDINTDPLAATAADPNAVLPFVFAQHSARKVTELGSRICDVSQYISDTFNSPNLGNTSGTLTGNTWGMLYTQVLGNLTLVKQDAATNGITNNNINAIATILTADAYYELTSLWEDVPVLEAQDGVTFPAPSFDSQETVLNEIVRMLDEGIALIDAMPSEGNFIISPTTDMFYGGDMESWKVLANSMKLRMLMLLRAGGADVTSQINATLSQPLLETNSQAAFINYEGTSDALNGMHGLVTAFFGPDNESTNVFGPGLPIDELLNGSGDPRWDLWVARNDLPAPGNNVFPDGSTSVLSNNVIRGDSPDIVMLPAEIDLYKAQLALEGVSAAGSATTNYQNGVRNAILWWGQDVPGAVNTVDSGVIDAYVNSLAVPTINDVYNQQYLASFLMPILSWNNVRRNKIPALDAPPGSAISTILKRFNYPPDEISANPNTPVNLATDVPMWFENL